MKKIKAAILVSLQYGSLLLFAASGHWFSTHIAGLAVQFAGVILASWAILEMRNSRINIAPCVRDGSRLIKTGPYRFLRHPMYLSILLLISPLMLESPGQLRLIAFMLLIPSLIMKLNFEEKRLLDYFGLHYAIYMDRTWKFIPFVY